MSKIDYCQHKYKIQLNVNDLQINRPENVLIFIKS